MSDASKGKVQQAILDQKVLSCILEFKTDLTDMPAILEAIEEEAKRLDTVISLGVAVRCDSEGNDAVRARLVEMGYDAWRAKINMGLGRHTNPQPAVKEAVK